MKKYLISTYNYTSEAQARWQNHDKNKLLDYLRGSFSGHLILASLPLRRMWKDFVDTFKPYKGRYQYNNDLKQVFTGLGRTGMALLLLCLLPVGIVYNGINLFRGGSVKALALSITLFPLEITTRLIAGLTQIATFPLTLLRIPLRSLITYFTGVPKIEDNVGIKSLVKKAQKAAVAGYSTALIDMVLREKVQKAGIERGQKTEIADVQLLIEARIPATQITYKTFLPTTPNIYFKNAEQNAELTGREETQRAELDTNEDLDTNGFTVTRRPSI